MTNLLSDATKARDAVCRVGRSLFERRMTFGSTGNISLRLTDGRLLMTPTNASLGELDPARLSLLSRDGALLGGDAPTKEAFLHSAMYASRAGAAAIVHLHSTHAVAISILADVDPENVLPAMTAYYVMRVGRLPLLPFFAPGDAALAELVRLKAMDHHALLLANHGPVVAGNTLQDAQYAAEELEETARLYLMLRQERMRVLTPQQIEEVHRRHGNPPVRSGT